MNQLVSVQEKCYEDVFLDGNKSMCSLLFKNNCLCPNLNRTTHTFCSDFKLVLLIIVVSVMAFVYKKQYLTNHYLLQFHKCPRF